jgi:hypothetical protein
MYFMQDVSEWEVKVEDTHDNFNKISQMIKWYFNMYFMQDVSEWVV